MLRYIKVEDACKEIDKDDLLVGNNADWAKEILYRTKSADVKEIIYGEWVNAWDNDKCTVCGFECRDLYYLGSAKYCPECGAKMKSEEKNNESCDKCRANKICDHNRFGFENCNNFIPLEIDVIKAFANELWSSLQHMHKQDLDLGCEIEHLVKEKEKKYANM